MRRSLLIVATAFLSGVLSGAGATAFAEASETQITVFHATLTSTNGAGG